MSSRSRERINAAGPVSLAEGMGGAVSLSGISDSVRAADAIQTLRYPRESVIVKPSAAYPGYLSARKLVKGWDDGKLGFFCS